MSLLIPDSGLLFWMVLSFGVVFFLLAKFGFPAITKSVQERRDYIETSLSNAKEAEEKLSRVKQEGDAIIDAANKEQGRLLRNASGESEKIIQEAKEEAARVAQKELEDAKKQIAVEREEMLLGIRREVATLSCDIAEKVIRERLGNKEQQMAMIEKMLEEVVHSDFSLENTAGQAG